MTIVCFADTRVLKTRIIGGVQVNNQFWLQVGDRVEHIKELGYPGTIREIDFNCYPFLEYGVTTALVAWDDGTADDIQWTNKLVCLAESAPIGFDIGERRRSPP